MELNQQQIQHAIQDINKVFGMSPKLKIIGAKDLLKQQIVDTVAKAIEEQEPKVGQLQGETVDVYNILIGAKPVVETGVEPALAEKTEVEVVEQDCFGISFDKAASECAPETCGRSAECAEAVTTKAAPASQKSKKGEAEPGPKSPSKKSICQELVRRHEGASLDEMAQAQTDAGLGDFDRNKKTSKLWMAKLGFPVRHDKESGRYFAA